MKYLCKILAATVITAALLIPWHTAGAAGPDMWSGWNPVMKPPLPVWWHAAPQLPYHNRIARHARWQPNGWRQAVVVVPPCRHPVSSVRHFPLPRTPMPLRVAGPWYGLSGWQPPVPSRLYPMHDTRPASANSRRAVLPRSPLRFVRHQGFVLRRG